MSLAYDQITNMERALSALESLPNDCSRRDWARIGCAAKAAGLSFDDFHNWSQGATNYRNEADVRSAWGSFKIDGSVTENTLFWLARNVAQWNDPTARAEKAPIEKPKAKHNPIDIWAASEPATAEHPYIMRKWGKPDGLRVVTQDIRSGSKSLKGWLAIPVWSSSGNLVSLQFVGPNKGEKRNASGCPMDGTFTAGKLEKGQKAYIVEGIGHAWSVNAVTGCAAVVSFGAGNIRKAADIIKAAGAVPVIVPDRGKESDAFRTGFAVATLPFDLAEGKDVNDLHQEQGADAVLAALNNARAGGVVDVAEETRRRLQQEENARLQQPETVSILPPSMSREEMLESMVWIASGEMVASVNDTTMFMTWKEFRQLTSASMTLSDERKKPVPTAVLWQQDPQRKTVITRTFHPGAGIFCRDPDGRPAINTWRPLERKEATAGISLFLDHVAYLFPDAVEREKFLDWLAHLEQKPGELPHYGWLHVANKTGTGRNWLASVLARVWRGYVAPNVDLPNLLDSQFNGQLAGRVLAIVDEIQAGVSENRYSHTNKLRSIVTAEYRDVNPKYGRQHREHNAMRWLVFSNHLNALPIDDTDRRWRIVHHEAEPRPQEVYATLYAALNDREFINAVAVFLAERDISSFNPGERPPMNAAKQSVIGAAKSMTQKNADRLVLSWPVDVITQGDIANVLSDGEESRFTPAMRRAMEEAGALQIDGPIKVHGKASRCWILRNKAKWLNADGKSQSREAQMARAGMPPLCDAQEVMTETAGDGEDKPF